MKQKKALALRSKDVCRGQRRRVKNGRLKRNEDRHIV